MNKPSTRVMEVFSSAVLHAAGERTDYLDRACDGDTSLRTEVESLLATQDRLSGFLDAPTVEEKQIDRAAEARFREAGSIAPGPEYIGRYRIQERIGEGGFGVVYAAFQDRPIKREVALKVVKLGMDTRQIIGRFESERQALALMDHPHIARIFDAGTTVDGRPYFVMELVRGEAITDYCDQHRLSISRRLELFLSVCQAVQHAHQKGIIHRDLKPSNILVAEVDGAAVAKVIDFGIAKAMESRPGQRTSITEQRHCLGTPQYMSPEQAGAGNGDIDTRSDIYSLGVILYELLTGATPFDAQTLGDRSFEQVHRIIREQEPRRPSAVVGASTSSTSQSAEHRGLDLQKLRRTICGELDWVVMKAIEKDRRRRYETAGALADDICHFLAHEPVAAGPHGTLYRLRKFARKYRGGLLAASAIALALLAGLAGTTAGLVRAKHDRDRAKLDRDRAEAALADSRQVTAFLSGMLQSANPDSGRGSQVLVRDLLDRTSAGLARGSLKNSPIVEAGIRTTLGNAYESLGLYSQAEAQLRAAVAIRRREQGNNNRETARTLAMLSLSVSHRGDFVAAEALAREALDIQEKLFGKEHPELIDTLIDLGLILRGKGEHTAAETVHRRAVDLCHKFAPRSNAAAVAMTDLAVVLMDRADWSEAEPLLRDALALDRQLHGEKFRNVPRNLSNLAVIQQQHGDLQGAESNWLEALRIQREMLPGDHPDTAWTLKLLGRLKRQQKQLGASENYTRQALEMERKIFGPTHPLVAGVMEDLALTLRAMERDDESLALERETNASHILHQTAAANANPNLIEHQASLANCLMFAGRFEEARQHFGMAATLASVSSSWLNYRAILDVYLNDYAAYEEARRRIIQNAEKSHEPLSSQDVLVLLLATPETGQLAHIAPLVVRTPRPDPTPDDLLGAGLADLREGRTQAIDDLASCRQSSTGEVRAASACYLAIALHRAGRDADSVAQLQAAISDFQLVPRLEQGYIGRINHDWPIAQIALREAHAELDRLGPLPGYAKQ